MATGRYPFRSVVAWGTLLFVLLALYCLPLTPPRRWVVAGSVVAVAVIVLIVCKRHIARGAATLPQSIEQALSSLPVGLHRSTPVILFFAVGDAAQRDRQVVYDGNALWLMLARPEELVSLVDGVRRWRGRVPDAAVLAVVPGSCANEINTFGLITRWRHALRDAGLRVFDRIPAWLALYAPNPTAQTAAGAQPSWRGVLQGAGERAMGVDEALQQLTAQLDVPSRFHADVRSALCDVRVQSAVRWAHDNRVPLFQYGGRGLPVQKFQGVVAGEYAACSNGSLLARWVGAHCAVSPAFVKAVSTPMPLPHCLVSQLTQCPRVPAAKRALLHAGAMAALFVSAAMYSSFVGNMRLVHRLHDDTTAFRALPDTPSDAKDAALAVLKNNVEMLSRYRHEGVPWRLSWWMYRGDAMLPSIEQAIASYRPPAPAPTMLTLDSLSLFASNSSQLKPDANRALVGALLSITRNPDKRVLIAGHTDSTGNARANQILSEARAAAVRDWFVVMSAVPASQFAIQGYGDTRPLVPNDSEENRARNRRVEITLVPDVPAH